MLRCCSGDALLCVCRERVMLLFHDTQTDYSLQKLAASIFIEGGNEKKKERKPLLGDSC